MHCFHFLRLSTSIFCLLHLVCSRRFQDYALDRSRRAEAATARQFTNISEDDGTSDYKYLSGRTEPYRVKSLPDVHYPLGEMYGGSIAITKSDPSRELFFMFKPVMNSDAPTDELTIFLNGGPGCSSMDAFFQENGPFVWLPGTFLPTPNDYTWANITNMLWVDQPVGTGFATGKITATSQFDIAADFVSWFKNFEQTFGIKNYKIYVTGESYAGRYVPYISSAMLNESDTEYYNLKGALVYDGCIGNFVYTQSEVVIYPFLESHNEMLGLNSSWMATMAERHKSCGYADLVDKYLQFPPPGNQPAITFDYAKHCSLRELSWGALEELNPCFNYYEINEQCPLLWDVLSFPTFLFDTPEGATTYFNRTDVKEAIHAPLSVDWKVCRENQVFVGKEPGPESENDDAPDPVQRALPQVIEATNRVLIANGDLDMVIITNGTLMSIQNMTWNGKLGFQSQPYEPIYITTPDYQYESVYKQNGYSSFVDKPQGTIGVQHFERGLMWAETYLSGHMEPEFQPRVSLQHLKWLLGLIEKL